MNQNETKTEYIFRPLFGISAETDTVEKADAMVRDWIAYWNKRWFRGKQASIPLEYVEPPEERENGYPYLYDGKGEKMFSAFVAIEIRRDAEPYCTPTSTDFIAVHREAERVARITKCALLEGTDEDYEEAEKK